MKAGRLCLKDHWAGSSLCNLCVLCVSVVHLCRELVNHRDTENTEVAQRRAFTPIFVQSGTGLKLSLIILVVAQSVLGQLPFAKPESVAVSSARLAQMDAAINSEIAQHHLPGAGVLVGRKGRVIWQRAYGARAIDPARETMTVDTIFDLASLTKVVATATSIMILIERGKVRLSDPISTYIPELKGEGREKITIEELLTHRSGYAPDFDLRERWTGYDEAIKHLIKEPLRNPPGTRFVYSDINYITLGEVVKRVSGLPLDQFAQRNIFQPLGMADTTFRPSVTLPARTQPPKNR